MIIGVPKEIKTLENRVALTPAGVSEFKRHGHTVLVEVNAGAGSGFPDEMYAAQGATIIATAAEVYSKADMILKVKEPLPSEYPLIREGQILFTYFHFASGQELTQAMIERKAICIAYETVQNADRSLPLLLPMSEVAGRMATQEGAKYLEKPMGGRGILLGGVPGVEPAKVVVVGGGVVGTQAAKMAAGLGAEVSILDVNIDRLRHLSDILPANVHTIFSNEFNLRRLLKDADLVIGSVLIPGAKAPKLITRDMLKDIRPGTVLVDVAIDQGGCAETSHATTHAEPTYVVDGVIHYCVANMPGAVPYTSTVALTNCTLPFGVLLANKGWRQACSDCAPLRLGLNMIEGHVVYKAVADAWGHPYEPVEAFLQKA